MTYWKNLLLPLLLCSGALGCNVCEDLDARMCRDLGEEDCATWKAKGLNFTAKANDTTRGRRGLIKSFFFGPGATMCRQAGKEPQYSKVLDSTKQALSHMKTVESESNP